MSKLIVDGNEVFPGTITIIDNNSTITPKDNLRVILNISGESTVTLSDGTDVTQRVEVFNASNDNCTLSYVSSAGNSTTVLAKNTSIRLLWVGTFWDYNNATTVTGIDDNGQPFAYNIDSLVEPKGVINITGKDANGNSFDYGLGKLVLAADEDNLVTGVEVKTSKTLNGKPIYQKYIELTLPFVSNTGSRRDYYAPIFTTNTIIVQNIVGYFLQVNGNNAGRRYAFPGAFASSTLSVDLVSDWYYNQSNNYTYARVCAESGYDATQLILYATVTYTKTTD